MNKLFFAAALLAAGLSLNAQTLQSGSFLINLPELKTATKTADGIYTVEIQPLQVTDPSTNQTVEYALNETGDFYDPAATVWQDSPVFPAHATTGAVYLLARSKKNATHEAGVIYHHAVYLDGKCNCSLGLTLPPIAPPVPVGSVSLNKAALSLTPPVNVSEQLTATVSPDNAADKTVTWTTSDASIATVSADGTVTAVALGTATITATAGGKTATCVVTVNDYDPGVIINGVKWATRNLDDVGRFAATPESFGKFYQWNRKKAWSATDATIENWDITNEPGAFWTQENDPSPAGWRVPTYSEFIGLLYNGTKVDAQWTTQNGVNGMRFTDKESGESVFFPAVGARIGYNNATAGNLYLAGALACYWTNERFFDDFAHRMYCTSDIISIGFEYCAFGYNIRCVAE